MMTRSGAPSIRGLSGAIPVRDNASGVAEILKILLTDDSAWSIQASAQLEFAQRFCTQDAIKGSLLAALDAAEVAVGRAAEVQ